MPAVLIAVLFLLTGFSVWCALGSPLWVLRLIGNRTPAPPLWIFGLLEFLAFTALGFSLGVAFGSRCFSTEVAKYKGGFYHIVGATLVFLHRLFFFKGISFFVASLTLLAGIVCLVTALLNFAKVSKISAVILALPSLWNLYLLALTLGALLFV